MKLKKEFPSSSMPLSMTFNKPMWLMEYSIRAHVGIWAVKAGYVLGLAYEKSGWRSKAIEQNQEFLEIWKDADPGIPEVEDAKERLNRLRAQG